MNSRIIDPNDIAELNSIAAYLEKNKAKHYLFKVLNVICEIAAYGLFVFLLILCIIILSTDPVKIAFEISKTDCIKYCVSSHDYETIKPIMNTLAFLTFLISLLPLIIGIMLTKNRNKNNRLFEAGKKVEGLIEKYGNTIN